MTVLQESTPAIHDIWQANKYMMCQEPEYCHGFGAFTKRRFENERGLSCIAAKEEARVRCTLTAHLLVTVPGGFRDMCFSRSTTSNKGDEIIPSRIQTYRHKFKKLINTIDEIT